MHENLLGTESRCSRLGSELLVGCTRRNKTYQEKALRLTYFNTHMCVPTFVPTRPHFQHELGETNGAHSVLVGRVKVSIASEVIPIFRLGHWSKEHIGEPSIARCLLDRGIHRGRVLFLHGRWRVPVRLPVVAAAVAVCPCCTHRLC